MENINEIIKVHIVTLNTTQRKSIYSLLKFNVHKLSSSIIQGMGICSTYI